MTSALPASSRQELVKRGLIGQQTRPAVEDRRTTRTFQWLTATAADSVDELGCWAFWVEPLLRQASQRTDEFVMVAKSDGTVNFTDMENVAAFTGDIGQLQMTIVRVPADVLSPPEPDPATRCFHYRQYRHLCPH